MKESTDKSRKGDPCIQTILKEEPDLDSCYNFDDPCRNMERSKHLNRNHALIININIFDIRKRGENCKENIAIFSTMIKY